MKRWVLSLTLLAVLLAAPAFGADVAKAKKERRLEHLSWNPVTCQLSWVVSEGTTNDQGDYVPSGALLNYRINMDAATMTHKTSTRGFSKDEAQQVHALLNLLKTYTEQSTSWWDAGKGERMDKLAKSLAPFVPAP